MTASLSQESLQSVSAGFDQKASRSSSLHANCYLDAHFLEVEKSQIFHKSWQFLCHEEKLREAGSYVAADVQGQSIVACRDTNGELRAFYNV
ncbi:MAG: aromatic ring-hydroxylating dioxygenase subunit alpha, partial [Gammaproteobacteria bacterium]